MRTLIYALRSYFYKKMKIIAWVDLGCSKDTPKLPISQSAFHCDMLGCTRQVPWVSCEFGVGPSTFSIWTLVWVATYATEADCPDFKGCCMTASSFSFFIRSQPSYPPNCQYRNAKFVKCMKIYCVAESRDTLYPGVRPMMAYTGRLHPKWVSFSDFRYMKGLGFL